MIHETPRVRFAPSPTGYLHVGGLRTALYNYLFAKKNNGTFILRIEDTDRKRFVEGAVENLINSLQWCGLEFDEGPGKEGSYGPYIQSERLDIYKNLCNELVSAGKAYYCFCTAERLDALRQEQEQNGKQKMYDKHCCNLSDSEVQANLANNLPYVIRMNIAPGLVVEFDDVIRGHISFNSEIIDDQVLLKSDGFPTYHLANVIDDHMMKITHVIRGEEWLPSTPKHVLLYQSFGWEVPQFAHLPLLLNPDRTKLSKRQGDVAVEDYRSKGYLKEALVNFVALLGWTAGDDREFYYLDELIEAFSLERVNKSGAVFDLQKLSWLNAEHLRKKTSEELLPFLRETMAEKNIPAEKFTDNYLTHVIDSMRERVQFIYEIVENAPYFFSAPQVFDESVIAKRWNEKTPELMQQLVEEFSKLSSNEKEGFETALKVVAEKYTVKTAELIHPLRLSLSGVGGGPGVYDIAMILGKEESINRIKTAIEKIK
ncbi:MAG: glutamate--tRNA ligase [Ignavibacteria bacterium]|nr:glutamate--tRNA ligase [Ignavibacteria bacterium]